MPQDYLALFRSRAARVGEIDFVMTAGCKVNCVSLCLRKGVHLAQCFRLTVVRTEVQTLNTKPLVVVEEFRLREICIAGR